MLTVTPSKPETWAHVCKDVFPALGVDGDATAMPCFANLYRQSLRGMQETCLLCDVNIRILRVEKLD